MSAMKLDPVGVAGRSVQEVSIEAQVDQAVKDMSKSISRRADRCFAVLMILQWIASIGIALWVTPRTWIGAVSSIDPYVYVAIFFGGIISLAPSFLAWKMPGASITRHVIAASQMLMSTLLIHLAGGRLEMHFHIFGSLAFLAFYLDWTVLLTASLVILLDHGLANLFWPQAVFGPGVYERWRWLEHTGWVVFCDIFLIASCVGRLRNLRELGRQAVNQKTLLRQAYTDALTGLPNRLRFHKDMELALAEAKETGKGFALMYVDLDRFKEVNDIHGHATGDRVLATVAARLMEEGAAATSFARIGGDEFVAIYSRAGHGMEEIAERANVLLGHLLTPIPVDNLVIQIGASIGLSLYPEDGMSEDQLLSSADTAMYSVKRKGRRGFVFYDGAMDATEEDRSASEKVLQKAIDEKSFIVYYQPQLSTAGKLDGLEALVRWSDLDGNIVYSPAEFIPLAEQTGLIVGLGQLVLEKVCEQIASWHASGIPFREVAINLSPRQLEHGGFLSVLDQTMARFSIDPEWITFEITESVYLPNDHVLEEGLHELRMRGIKVSLDDFGTGYSSLGRLHGLAFNTLKIDQIFVSGLGQRESAVGMVKAIIDLAHLMGMKVVGEGVENAVQASILRKLGCDRLQGFYLSRPLNVEAAQEFILIHGESELDMMAILPDPALCATEVDLTHRRALAQGVAELVGALTTSQHNSNHSRNSQLA